MSIKLGKSYIDSITGFEGIAIASCTYLNGCISIQLRPKVKDGEMVEAPWFDEQQLTKKSRASCGGGARMTPPELDTP